MNMKKTPSIKNYDSQSPVYGTGDSNTLFSTTSSQNSNDLISADLAVINNMSTTSNLLGGFTLLTLLGIFMYRTFCPVNQRQARQRPRRQRIEEQDSNEMAKRV